MAEFKQEVKTYEVNYQCDKCGKGNMVFIAGSPCLLSSPPKYLHTCNNKECREVANFTHTYPYTTTEVTE